MKCKKPDVFRKQKQNKPRNTNTNQDHALSWMYAGKSLIIIGNVGYQSTCGIFLCRREKVLSAPRVLIVLKA